ncbi:hypothetical protein AgCh_022024 [Apium graveolens]
MGDLLSCLVVVASESIERFIEPELDQLPRNKSEFSTKMYGIGPKKAIQDSEDEPADPNIIYEEPDDEACSSDKDVSDATFPPCERAWIREGNRSDVPLTQPGNGPEGTAAWGMSASRRKAHL